MWDMQVVVMWDMRVVDKVEEAVGSFSVFCKFKSVVDQFVGHLLVFMDLTQ